MPMRHKDNAKPIKNAVSQPKEKSGYAEPVQNAVSQPKNVDNQQVKNTVSGPKKT